MPGARFLSPLLLILVLVGSAAPAGAEQGVPYRLLGSRDSGSGAPVREIDYNVSVEQNLDASGIKNIVCQLYRAMRPGGYQVLNIGIYYKLEKYGSGNVGDGPDVDDAGEAPDPALLRAHRIAQYHWNKDSPKDPRRLVVSKDEKGLPLKEWRFYNFDHTRSCN